MPSDLPPLDLIVAGSVTGGREGGKHGGALLAGGREAEVGTRREEACGVRGEHVVKNRRARTCG
jgi:hypothetical protein